MRAVVYACALIALLALGCSAAKISESEVPRMDAQELQTKLGDPDVVVLDVRGAPPEKAPELKITGSITEDPGAIDQWAGNYAKDKTLVLYCA